MISEFDKDDYLNDLPDPPDTEAVAQASSGTGASVGSGSAQGSAAQAPSDEGADAAPAAAEGEKTDEGQFNSTGTLTPLDKAEKEATNYLEALQREHAEFINYRNCTQKEQERFRQHGIIDVLTTLLPAPNDIDRIREHSEMDDSFKAVATKIGKAFEELGVEKFDEKGGDLDPAKHNAILCGPDAGAEKETVDTVVGTGYRIGDRVIHAARVVIVSPQN